VVIDLTRVRALCFDVDGTLRDTDDQYVEQLAGWLRPIRFAFPRRDARGFSRRVIMAMESPATYLYTQAERLGFDIAVSRLLQRAHRVGVVRHPARMLLVPHVVETVQALSQRYPLSIISARHEEATLGFLRQFNLLPFFKAIATAHTCKYTKPFPDPVIWSARQMGVAPDACLMIGDTTVDMRAAKAAGAQAIGVLCGFGREDELRKAGADLILQNTAELIGRLAENAADTAA